MRLGAIYLNYMRKRKAQVVIFCRDEDGEKHFLLLKTNKKRGEYWQNVTGSVEKNETYKEGALREAEEETGISQKEIVKVRSTELCFQFHDRWGRDVKEKTFVLEASHFFKVKIDPSEHCDFKWISENKIKAKVFKHINNYLSVVYAMETKC